MVENDLLFIAGLIRLVLLVTIRTKGNEMESSKKFKHHLVRKHNQIGSKTIKVFPFNDFVAAKTMCDELNVKASETNPMFRFEIITMEVK
jgi:hypothetical protein